MLYLAIGVLITLTLVVVPGYSLSTLSRFHRDSTAEALYVGFILSIAILILLGFVLARFHMFTPFWILLFLISYNLLAIVLKYSVGSTRNRGTASTVSTLIRGRTNKTNLALILVFATTLLIAFAYTQLSPMPIGYDRGQHFGRSVHLITHHTLEETDTGTNYNPFYFQGSNLILSILVVSTTTFSERILDIQIQDFGSLISLSRIFNFYFALLISMNVFAIYFVSSYAYRNEKLSLLSLLIFLSLCGFGIATVGSIGTIIGFLLLSVFFVYLDVWLVDSLEKFDYAFLVLIIEGAILTHIISAAFLISFSVLLLGWKVIKKETRIDSIPKTLLLILLCFLSSLVLLYIFAPLLLRGILEELLRKFTHKNEIIPYAVSAIKNKGYVAQNLEMLSDMGIVLLLVSFFPTIGFLYDLKHRQSITIPLTICSLIFVLVPIITLVKPMNYLIFPISILGGLGLFQTLESVRKHGAQVLCIFLICVTGIALSTNSAFGFGSTKLYYDVATYREAYKLSVWLNKELDPSFIVLFPDSGAPAYLINALSHNKILFAEPRYPDLPSFAETSKLYIAYPASTGFYDFSGISIKERRNIINKYDISVIVESGKRELDMELFRQDYAMKIHHPTPSYRIIILGKKTKADAARRISKG